MKRIGFYGGSFDPPHNGHLTIARKLSELFELDEFVFIPAFRAPHKKGKSPTLVFHRYAMLVLAGKDEAQNKVSTVELEVPAKPYTVETLSKLKKELTDTKIFFVMGADSWAEIDTWREWETVLTLTNVIVVARPNYEIGFSHVSEKIKKRIVDLRGNHKSREIEDKTIDDSILTNQNSRIYITDAVNLDVSSTDIRRKIQDNNCQWRELVPEEVAKYIEKYDIY
ncbi:MAG: nicotinate-nucleotide adenylyltransferase [Acidobacteriota bacterium]|nr:nicotinate-nucleotide adenylyltransferase [Acidobacteriota bacterium]